MPLTLDQLREEALALPAEQRNELADSLYVSLEEDSFNLHPSWTAEVERRSEEFRSGKVQGIPWEDVKRGMDSLIDGA